jgi:hypothetical protein
MGLDDILGAAQRHGERSDLDHEVRDRQEALAIAWEEMDEAQRDTLVRRFFAEVADEEDEGSGGPGRPTPGNPTPA